jgi:hypothetical protein
MVMRNTVLSYNSYETDEKPKQKRISTVGFSNVLHPME